MRRLRKFMHGRDRGHVERRSGREDGLDGSGGRFGLERFGLGRFGLGRFGRGRRDADRLAHPSARWPAGDVVAECEAFLTGTYRQLLVRSGRAVPGWAWINQLAHGMMDDVRSVARFAGGSSRVGGNGSAGGTRMGGRDGDEAVDAFVGRLALQVLVKVRQEQAPLDAVQRDLLIPLELALAAQARRVPIGADDLSRAVSQRLVSGLEPIDVGVRGGEDAGEERRRAHGDDGGGHGGKGTGSRGAAP